jgi:hypothetical protein
MKAFALKFVRYDRIEDHLRQGWMVMFPNGPHHHQHYGIEMKWVCPCEVPGGFSVAHRVPNNHQQESAHGAAGAQ